jgi:hypothetical protein
MRENATNEWIESPVTDRSAHPYIRTLGYPVTVTRIVYNVLTSATDSATNLPVHLLSGWFNAGKENIYRTEQVRLVSGSCQKRQHATRLRLVFLRFRPNPRQRARHNR